MPIILSFNANYTSGSTTISGLSDFDNIADNMFVGLYLKATKRGTSSTYYRRITANDSSQLTLESALGSSGYYECDIISWWWQDGSDYVIYYLDRNETLTTLLTDYLNRSTGDVNDVQYKKGLLLLNRMFATPIRLDDDKHLNLI